MKHRLKLLLLICHYIAALSLNGAAEPLASRNTSAMLTPAEMKQDIARLAEDLLMSHPSTINGLSEKTHKCINDAYAKCQKPMNIADFYFILAEITCSLNDAHTRINPPPSYCDMGFYDLEVKWFQDGLYVIKNSGDLKKGDKIISIGKKTPKNIINTTRGFLSHENEIRLKYCTEAWLTIGFGLNALRALNSDGTLDVEYQRENEKKYTRLEMKPKKEPPSEAPGDWVNYKIDKEHSLGIFTLNACINDKHYQEKLKQFFSEVTKAGIKNIIVDLRHNYGGDSNVCEEFIRYLNITEFRTFAIDERGSEQLCRSWQKKSDAGLLNKEMSIKCMKYAQNIKGKLVSYPSKVSFNRKVDKDLLFNGQVWILSSSPTFSSGIYFSVILQDNKIGKIIGEEPSGTASAYGDIMFLELPCSKLENNISSKKFIRPQPSKGFALIPDIIVPTTIDDFIARRDPQMDKIRELIINSGK